MQNNICKYISMQVHPPSAGVITSSCAAGPTSPETLALTANVYLVKGLKPVRANRVSAVLFSYKYPGMKGK